MKTNYVIYDNNFEEVDIVFDNEADAKFFVKLNSEQFKNYHYKKQFVYESFKDYLKNNKYQVAEMLNKLSNKIVSGEVKFDLHFKNGITSADYRDIKYMAYKKTVTLSCMWDKNRKPIKIEDSDIDVVVNKCNEIEDKLKKYKILAQKLEKEAFINPDNEALNEVLNMDL